MAEEGKKKVGRPASGLPLDEVRRRSTRKRAERLKEGGRVRIDSFVLTDTKDLLAKLEEAMQLNTQGEVIDALVLAEAARQKII